MICLRIFSLFLKAKYINKNIFKHNFCAIYVIELTFPVYLWHYGAVNDAMAAAAYIKFENSSQNSKCESMQ